MIRKPFIYILFAALVVGAIVGRLSSCGETSSGSDNWAPLDYESNPASAKYDFSNVDSAVQEFMGAHPTVKGVTLAVVRRGESQIYEKGYGDFRRDRISLLASTTKVLSAGVILTLVDEGLLDLDRPVADYLDWGDHHPTVTVRHLLSMTSGIPAIIPGTCFPARCMCDPSTTVQNCGRDVFQNDSTSILPEKEFRYSSGAWQLAGAVAEVVSGRTWAELVEERLLARCGLPNTGYGNEGLLAGHPEAFDPDNLRPTENPWIDGGAYSTVNDYSKVLLMHLEGGLCRQVHVLSPEMVRAMQEDLVPEGVAMPDWWPEASNYGMGWWKYEDEPGLLIDPGAWGARALLHPDEGWGAIMIIETTSDDGRDLRERLVPVIRAALVEADQN